MQHMNGSLSFCDALLCVYDFMNEFFFLKINKKKNWRWYAARDEHKWMYIFLWMKGKIHENIKISDQVHVIFIDDVVVIHDNRSRIHSLLSLSCVYLSIWPSYRYLCIDNLSVYLRIIPYNQIRILYDEEKKSNPYESRSKMCVYKKSPLCVAFYVFFLFYTCTSYVCVCFFLFMNS